MPSSWYVLRSFLLGYETILRLGRLGLQAYVKGTGALSHPALVPGMCIQCILRSEGGFGGVWCRAVKQCCQESCPAAAGFPH